MSQVLIDYSRAVYNDAQLVTEVMSVETKMTGNVNFATPNPLIPAITAQRKKYQDSLALSHRGTPEQTSDKNVQRGLLEKMMHELGAYVQLTSGGDETKILSSGMHTAASKGTIGEFGVVENFKVETPESSNKVIVSCRAMPKAAFYEVLYTASPETDASVWVTVTSTKHTMEISGLKSFIPYIFKMAARGASSIINFSVPITRAAN